MSTLAIKNFFDHQREVTVRREAWVNMMEDRIKHASIVEEETNTVFDEDIAHFDFLLKRNWFLAYEDIVEFLWDADVVVFQEIVKRRTSYPTIIQDAISSLLPTAPRPSTLKIRNITNDEMDLREANAAEQLRTTLNTKWNAYKIEMKLAPPVGDLDAGLEDLFVCLQQLKKDLEDAKKKSLSGRYVPPAIRDKIVTEDPRVIEVSKKIEIAENEIICQTKYIEQEKNEWFMRKQAEFEYKQMFSL